LSRYQDITFKLFLYSSDFKKDQIHSIKGGDIIRLKHTELGGYITADRCYEGKFPECYIRKYIGEYKEEEMHVDSLWEVEVAHFKHRGNYCKIDDEERKLKLRHFTTGKLLMMHETIKKDGNKYLIPVLGDHVDDQNKKYRELNDEKSFTEFKLTDVN
jgi:dolichyl-phosphate-mannose--protein O-mannosyl transferase